MLVIVLYSILMLSYLNERYSATHMASGKLQVASLK